MNYKTGKWAGQILELRNNDGMWGNFHTLSKPVNNKSITTEQAIRRLRILGYTKEDDSNCVRTNVPMCKGQTKN